MCNSACKDFVRDNLSRKEVSGKRVLEVGAMNVNGSVRDGLLALSPSSYTGADLAPGPGVDVVCGVTELAGRFGRDSFDVVVSTEMLEHVLDWRGAVKNLKEVLKPGGVLLLTTRSPGYPYHGYPHDFWRFEDADFCAIFSDMEVLITAPDPLVPGVFLKAAKPPEYAAKDLSRIALYSIIAGKRRLGISDWEIYLFRVRKCAKDWVSAALPDRFKHFLRTMLRLGQAADRK